MERILAWNGFWHDRPPYVVVTKRPNHYILGTKFPAAQTPSPENSWRVPIPVQTQEPPCGTSAVLTTTCATTEALA